jgi:hypothetical protein
LELAEKGADAADAAGESLWEVLNQYGYGWMLLVG